MESGLSLSLFKVVSSSGRICIFYTLISWVSVVIFVAWLSAYLLGWGLDNFASGFYTRNLITKYLGVFG